MANQFQGTKVAHIVGAATTVIKSGSGFLHTVNIGAAGATDVTIYDNTAGSGNIIAATVSGSTAQHFTFDCVFYTGLTVVTAGVSSVTVTYE